MRTLQSLDGATLLGGGTVGNLALSLPGLLLASPPSGVAEGLPPGLALVEGSSPPGEMRRALRLRQGENVLDLSFPVPTPEVSGGGGAPTEMGPRIVGVRTPVSTISRKYLEEGAFDLVIWLNARAARTDSAGFVRGAIELREAAGPGPLLWAPRVATPGRLALLYSLGIDLLDTTEGLWATAEGHQLEADAEDLEGEKRGELPPLLERARSTTRAYVEELEKVRRFAGAGRLRELVEMRLVPEPQRGEILRYFDSAGSSFEEVHAPVVGRGVRPYTTKEALRRPEVERFRSRFLSRYRPPSGMSTLLLVPCSKTKPYSNSPTHRRIARALEGGTGERGLHWVSATSPLGLVPRELESVYPARNYDIPVTGAWDEDERRWVSSALRHLLSVGSYTTVVAHLPREEYRWLEADLPPERSQWTVEGDATTSMASLARLQRAVREARASVIPRPGGPLARVREELQTLASFQFGPDLATALFSGGVRLMGRPWFQRLTSPEKEDLATWKEETGLWRLTVPGARRVLPSARGYRVELRGGVEIKGDLFAPGVLTADPELRVGDDALLVRQGEVVGVGEAKVPGPWMGRLPRGLVVKVRHRAHPTA